MKEKILIISGPTASGKSSLALGIAKEVNSVIINSDSIQLYKELPILSSQPSKNDLLQNKHVLYSILSHKEDSSVNNWLSLAIKEIDKALKNNKLPILVGGTGLYLSKLIDGINEVPEIKKEAKEYCLDIFLRLGKDGLIKELLSLGDKEYKVLALDKQRLMRRLEVLKQTGKILCYWQDQPIKKYYDDSLFVHVNVNLDRDLLYKNCNDRFELMLKNGAIQEVKNFLGLNVENNLPIAKTIGLSEIRDYLRGDIDKDEMVRRSSQKTRNYAKRQLTWFRNQFKNNVEVKDVSRETIKFILNLL